MPNGTPAAKGVVYGPGNLGLATRLKRESPNLFSLIQREQDKAAADETAKRKAAQERGKQMMKDMEFNPDKVWMEYSDWKTQEVGNYMNEASAAWSQDQGPSMDQRIGLRKRQIDLNTNINKINQFKKEIDGFVKQAKDDDEISEEFASEYLGGLIYDEKGNKLPPEALDPEMISSLYENPDLYNTDVVVSNFAESIPEQIISRVDPTRVGHDEITIKSKFYKLDSNGDPELDDNANPVMNITPELVGLAKGNHNLNLKMSQMKEQLAQTEGRNNVTDKEALTALLKPQAYSKEKVNREQEAIKTARYKYGLQKKEKGAENFLSDLDRLINGAPEEITTSDYKYYMSEDGELNQGGNGRPLIPVRSALLDSQIGYDPEDKTKVTIDAVYKDQNTGIVYLSRSNTDALEPLTSESALSILQKYDSYNKTDYALFANERGHVGTNNVWQSRLSREVEDPKVAAQKQKQAEISDSLKTVKGRMSDVMSLIETGGKGSLWGYNDGEVQSINDTLATIPSGVNVTIGTKTYENPSIEIQSGFWGTKSGYEIYVDGEKTGVSATKENIESLMKSLKANTQLYGAEIPEVGTVKKQEGPSGPDQPAQTKQIESLRSKYNY